MIGKSTIVWIGLAGVASFILYQTSYRAQEQQEKLVELNRRIVAEQEAIQVLRAEWAYLNDPVRIEKLAAELTELEPLTAVQIATLDQLPEKPPADGEIPVAEGEKPNVMPASAQPARKPARPPLTLATYGAAR